MVKISRRILVFAFAVLPAAIWLILFENMWDLAARLLLVAAIVPSVWALLKKESNKLELTITLLASFGIAWLIWVENVSILYGVPLLAFALIAVKWTIRGQAQANKLAGFFVKTFTLFLIGTSIAYFIWLGIAAPYTYSVYPIHAIVEMGMVFILPISLLLEAIAIVIYGIYRIKLKPGEIFLCSWYISVFVIFVIYAVWLIPYPPWAPPPEEMYPINPSGSLYSGVTSIVTCLQLSFLPAAICTIVYIRFKKPQVQKPT